MGVRFDRVVDRHPGQRCSQPGEAVPGPSQIEPQIRGGRRSGGDGPGHSPAGRGLHAMPGHVRSDLADREPQQYPARQRRGPDPLHAHAGPPRSSVASHPTRAASLGEKGAGQRALIHDKARSVPAKAPPAKDGDPGPRIRRVIADVRWDGWRTAPTRSGASSPSPAPHSLRGRYRAWPCVIVKRHGRRRGAAGKAARPGARVGR